jgi:hypothetical protein
MTQTAFSASTQLSARGRGMKFTPERIQQIRNLVERGKRREEIAELIGVTVGSLQVTCSRLGISLRRVVFDTGTGLLRRDRPHSDSRGGSLLVKQAQALHQERARTNGADLANLALRMQYRGHERIVELPLTQDMIRQLAFEAQFRDMSIGELVGEVIIAMMRKELFQRVLDEGSVAPGQPEPCHRVPPGPMLLKKDFEGVSEQH